MANQYEKNHNTRSQDNLLSQGNKQKNADKTSAQFFVFPLPENRPQLFGQPAASRNIHPW